MPAKPLEQLFGRDAFFAISLVERVQKLSFVPGRQTHCRFNVSSHNGYEGTLGQGQPFNDDLAIYDGTGGYLHALMIPQSRKAVYRPCR